MSKSDAVDKVVKHIPDRRRSSTIGLLASLAVVLGYFLPWTPLTPLLEESLGLDTRLVARSAGKGGEKEHIDLADRLRRGEAISGNDWAKLLETVEEQGGLDDANQRIVRAAKVGVAVLPFTAGVLALLLLASSVAPGRAVKMGLAPLAGVLAVAQSRWVSGFVSLLTMSFATLVVATAGTLWGAATRMEDGVDKVGLGIQLLAGGSGVALLTAFLGHGPGRLRALLWSWLLLAIGVGALAVYLACQ